MLSPPKILPVSNMTTPPPQVALLRIELNRPHCLDHAFLSSKGVRACSYHGIYTGLCMSRSTRKIGDVNRNGQRLVAKTSRPGNDHLQYVWALECTRSNNGSVCGHRYGANGSDFHIRKCPHCQGGAPGLPIEAADYAKTS
jgi:hypothetical protein